MGAVAIVGRGRLGVGLAKSAMGLVITGGREPSATVLRRARVWILAVPDPEVRGLAQRLAKLRAGTAGRVVLHTSASLSLDALGPLADRGAAVGVMHPLVSFAARTRPPPLAGTTFVLGGSRAAVVAGAKIARRCGARPLARPIHGPRYHALAALLANGSAALAGVVQRELEAMGLSASEARAAAGGLLGSVAANVGRLGLPEALTGPVARGDLDAVRAQRDALGASRSGQLYVALGPAIVREARAGGLSPAVARRIAALFRC